MSDEQIELFKATTEETCEVINEHIDMATFCGELPTYIEILQQVLSLLDKSHSTILTKKPNKNFLKKFLKTLQNISNLLSSNRLHLLELKSNGKKEKLKKLLSDQAAPLSSNFSALEFEFTFFSKLNFCSKNIVAIGSNGAGKSSLARRLQPLMGNNGIVISAQRILLIPAKFTIHDREASKSRLNTIQKKDKTIIRERDINDLQGEFGVVLHNLLSEHTTIANSYLDTAREAANKSLEILPPPTSRLDRTLKIWNELITHRELTCKNGMDLLLECKSDNNYPASQMSDGEKVLLFHAAQVLQTPKDGFVIIDEPETYLHKSILKRLWDILETERSDCIFIYLTHDLDFASSRSDAKKVWIKSYSPTQGWNIEDIPKGSIPESLTLELIGSKKNILFCEGTRGKKDDRIYRILFPHLTVIPVGSCQEVINHTKAFNKLENVNTKALGLIDADHQPKDRLEKLANDCIYSLRVAEIENILLDEEFLDKFSKRILSQDSNAIDKIKSDILNKLEQEKSIQAANHSSSKVDFIYKEENVSKGNSLEELEKNLDKFNKKISAKEWYEERVRQIEGIIKEESYHKAISIFNNKGLRHYANVRFDIRDFSERAIKFLQDSNDNSYLIKKYFPEEIMKK
jgi:ATPase subunit of ABC transporter with duplicated ATPase domains